MAEIPTKLRFLKDCRLLSVMPATLEWQAAMLLYRIQSLGSFHQIPRECAHWTTCLTPSWPVPDEHLSGDTETKPGYQADIWQAHPDVHIQTKG